MEFFLVGLVALIVGFLLAMKLAAKGTAALVKEIEKTQAIDRANYLFTLRRELANLLIWRKPRRYLQLYHELSSELVSLESWRIEEINKRLAELCKKYPSYNDFDIISSREYVLYADGASWINYEELEERYRDIVTFCALSLIGDSGWKDASRRGFISLDFTHKFKPAMIEHLSKYVQSIEDTSLILKMDQGMETFYINFLRTNQFENDSYSVHRIDNLSPDNRYGFHFKLTNDFAIYSSFLYDDGRISSSYYRSDSTFEKLEPLFSNVALLDELKRRL